MDNPEQQWAQETSEQAKSYNYFKMYLDLGRNRTIVQTAKNIGCSVRRLNSLSRKYNWLGRAQKYDLYLDLVERRERERVQKAGIVPWAERREELRQQEWNTAQQLIAKAKEMLTFPLFQRQITDEGKTTIIKPIKWTMRDVAAFLDVASKLSRLAADMETDRTVIDIQAARNNLAEILGVPPELIAQEYTDQELTVN